MTVDLARLVGVGRGRQGSECEEGSRFAGARRGQMSATNHCLLLSSSDSSHGPQKRDVYFISIWFMSLGAKIAKEGCSLPLTLYSLPLPNPLLLLSTPLLVSAFIRFTSIQLFLSSHTHLVANVSFCPPRSIQFSEDVVYILTPSSRRKRQRKVKRLEERENRHI